MSQGSPPVLDYDVDMIEPPRWPKVVGIISIVLGALYIGCIGCAVVGGVIGQSMMPPQMQQNPPPNGMTPLAMLSMGLSSLGSVALIIAGGMTLGRRIVGRYIHLAYVAYTLLVFPMGILVQIQNRAAMQVWLQNNPEMAKLPGMSVSTGPLGLIISISVSVIFGLTYPLFLAIWFGFVKRTQASMTGEVARETPAA